MFKARHAFRITITRINRYSIADHLEVHPDQGAMGSGVPAWRWLRFGRRQQAERHGQADWQCSDWIEGSAQLCTLAGGHPGGCVPDRLQLQCGDCQHYYSRSGRDGEFKAMHFV